jgi:predicted NBD/HSP70 family sugar kinase
MPSGGRTASQLRWHNAAKLIALVRAEPGITRAVAAQRLGIGTGGATDLVARLKAARLIDEAPAPVRGRGRPTTVLTAHPDGPLVLAVELRSDDWRLAVAGIDGTPRLLAQSRHDRADHSGVFDTIARKLASACRKHAGRVTAIGVSVAGTLSDSRLVQFTQTGWRDLDLTALAARLPDRDRARIPVLLGNDATLAGVAEARFGSARGAATVLHLIVEVGLGGTLIVDGEPVMGSHGAAGEYGHIPFGDPTSVCPCGARGCWDMEVDGRALARHRGDPPPIDAVGYAKRILATPTTTARGQTAFASVAAALGRGVAGLVNIHDPDIVTLGALAPSLRAAASTAFDTAYQDGLMTFRKHTAPPVRDGVLGDRASLVGATELALDHATSEAALADWTSERPRGSE